MDLFHFNMCGFSTGTPKCGELIIFSHINTIVRIVKHIVFINPTEELVRRTDRHRWGKNHRVGAVSIRGRILHRRGSFTVHIIGDGKGLRGKVTERYKRDVTIHTHVCTECGLRGIGVHDLPPHGMFVIRARGDTLQSLTRHQITIMHGNGIRGTISRGRLVNGNRIVRSNPFGIKHHISSRHYRSSVYRVTFTVFILIPSAKSKALLAYGSISTGQYGKRTNWLLIFACLSNGGHFCTIIIEFQMVRITEINQCDSTVRSKLFRMIKSTGTLCNSSKPCFAFRLFREPLNVAIFFRISDKIEKGGHRFSIISRPFNILKIIIYSMLIFIAVVIEVERHIRTRHGGNGLQRI